jgi:hypothetical protein
VKSGVKFWTRATASNAHNQPGGFWNPDSSRREPNQGREERNAVGPNHVADEPSHVFPPCAETIVEQIRLDFLFCKIDYVKEVWQIKNNPH